MIALIPARAGSKRCPGKNTRILAGHPLIAYTIAAAQESSVFVDGVTVCTDDASVWTIAESMGAMSWARSSVADVQPDIEWVQAFFRDHRRMNYPDFAILRPTSPFRTAATIRRAYEQFQQLPEIADSLRAVEPVKQHPGKMWTIPCEGQPMYPILAGSTDGVPNHSCPTQVLPPFYVQNSSLEMAKRRCVDLMGSISGHCVFPFFTEGLEGFAIDTEEDWQKADTYAQKALPMPSGPARA